MLGGISVVDKVFDCLFEIEFFEYVCGFDCVDSELFDQEVHLFAVDFPLSKIYPTITGLSGSMTSARLHSVLMTFTFPFTSRRVSLSERIAPWTFGFAVILWFLPFGVLVVQEENRPKADL